MTEVGQERMMLVVPDGAINPWMGGGQRSGILFSAMKRRGPVDVVILGIGHDTGVREFFPGAASVQWVQSDRFAVTTRNRLAWLLYNINRFAFLSKRYAPEPAVQSAFQKIVTDDHRIVVFRYALTFCTTGLMRQAGRDLLVDIDDRDDQAFLSTARAMFKVKALSRLFETLVVPAVQAQLRMRLQQASLLWYATPEDDLEIEGPDTAVLRNVPFIGTSDDNLSRPSANEDILFVGTYGHGPNQDGVKWFLRNCWREVHRRHPNSRLKIVGLGPWHEAAAEFPDLDGVDYVGTVDDVTDSYSAARIVISPLFQGGGSKIKVIEACAFARPVIVSSHSARGFGTEIGSRLPQADDAAGFIALCDRYLGSAHEADRLGQDLKTLQQQYFSRTATETQIEKDIAKIRGR